MSKKFIFIMISVLTANLLATVHIYDLWELNDGDVTLNEDLYIHAGGIVQPYNASRILTVNGNIINEGTIRNYPSIGYLLTVNCTGNITNAGLESTRFPVDIAKHIYLPFSQTQPDSYNL